MDGEEAELKVVGLLRDMGFNHLDSNVEPQDHPEQIIGEVDSIFKCGHTLLIVEVGTGRHRISDKKKKFFSKWESGPSLDALIRKINWKPRRTLRVYFDMRPRLSSPGRHDLDDTTGPGTGNRICYQDDFDRLMEGARSGIMIKHDFLQDFEKSRPVTNSTGPPVELRADSKT